MKCEVCNSDNSLFEIQGDMTCVKCGVVTMTRMIDDTCNFTQQTTTFFNSFKDPKLQKIQKWCETPSANVIYKDILVNKMQMDESFIETTCEWFEKATKKGIIYKYKKKRISNEIFVCCAYSVSIYMKRGIDITRFCDFFNVKRNRAMGIFPQVCQKWNGENWYKQLMKDIALMASVEKLRRCVYELSIIDKEHQWSVIKNAEKIYSKVRCSPTLQKVRTTSINATCIYIACKIERIKVRKDVFSKETNISIPTLNATELLIQEALKLN
jgi:transcription initiation factor TFIIIB Brf1 subunit/transcription initiation factor TFIIB